jgi:hypothetical protein
MYGSLDVVGGRIKTGVTLQDSKGHYERIQSKPPRAYWGVSMGFHVAFSLGKCMLDVAIKRLRIYELIVILGLYPFLVDPDHEVILFSWYCPQTALVHFPQMQYTGSSLNLTYMLVYTWPYFSPFPPWPQVTWMYDLETNQAIARLVDLMVRRVVKLDLDSACEVLEKLAGEVQQEADSEANAYGRRNVEGVRAFVKSLTARFQSSGPETRRSGQGLFDAEEKDEQDWALKNSFCRVTGPGSSQSSESDQLTFLEHVEYMASFQSELRKAGFSGGCDDLSKHLSKISLMGLVKKAKNALGALRSTDVDGDGYGGNDGNDGGGGSCGGRSGERGNSDATGGGSGGGGNNGSGGGCTRTSDDSGRGGGGGGDNGSGGGRTRTSDDSGRGGGGGGGDNGSGGGRTRTSDDSGRSGGGVGDNGSGGGCIRRSDGSGSGGGRGSGCDRDDRGGGGCAGQGYNSSHNADKCNGNKEFKVWYADENPSAIPKAQREEEQNRRIAALLELRARNERAVTEATKQLNTNIRGEVGEPLPVEPKVTKPRIWYQGRWVDRIPVPQREIKGWRMANLRGANAALAGSPPSSRILNSTDRGDKYVEGDRIFLRRAQVESLALFNGDKELPEGHIVGPYVGRLIAAALEAQGRHKTRPEDCTHHLTLCPGWASLPPTESGIEGAVHQVPVQGRLQDISYFLRNGVASLANSRSRSDANCKLIVEYKNYENAGGKLYLDDEYCPEHVPLKQRV